MKTTQKRGTKVLTPEIATTPSPFSTDPHDPPFWPVGQMFIEKVERLAALSPDKAQAVHVLVDVALRETWWQMARTPDGLARLLALTREGEAR